jgi:hypothetical protein
MPSSLALSLQEPRRPFPHSKRTTSHQSEAGRGSSKPSAIDGCAPKTPVQSRSAQGWGMRCAGLAQDPVLPRAAFIRPRILRIGQHAGPTGTPPRSGRGCASSTAGAQPGPAACAVLAAFRRRGCAPGGGACAETALPTRLSTSSSAQPGVRKCSAVAEPRVRLLCVTAASCPLVRADGCRHCLRRPATQSDVHGPGAEAVARGGRSVYGLHRASVSRTRAAPGAVREGAIRAFGTARDLNSSWNVRS